MNLRILKKLSKRALPLLRALGEQREDFLAGDGRSYIKTLILDRSCWDRGASVHGDRIGQHEIKWLARKPGRRCPWAYMAPPSSPLKGTVMVGGVSGYYEPEWDEETAWCALSAWVWESSLDYRVRTDENGEEDICPVPTIRLRTPSDIFRAAQRMVTEKQAEDGARLARRAALSSPTPSSGIGGVDG